MTTPSGTFVTSKTRLQSFPYFHMDSDLNLLLPPLQGKSRRQRAGILCDLIGGGLGVFGQIIAETFGQHKLQTLPLYLHQ